MQKHTCGISLSRKCFKIIVRCVVTFLFTLSTSDKYTRPCGQFLKVRRTSIFVFNRFTFFLSYFYILGIQEPSIDLKQNIPFSNYCQSPVQQSQSFPQESAFLIVCVFLGWYVLTQ